MFGVSPDLAALAGQDLLSWGVNASIGVLATDGTFVKFDITEGGNTAEAKFSATLEEGVTLSNVAVYPYDERLAVSGGVITLNLPANYDAGEVPAILPLFAKIAEGQTDPLSFNLLNGYVALKVTNVPLGAAKVTFTTAGLSLAGNFDLDLTAETLAINSVAGDADNTVTFKVNAPSAINTEATYIIPVPAGTYPEYTVKYYDQYGYEMNGQSQTVPANVEVAAGSFVAAPDWACKTSAPATHELKVIRNDWNAVAFRWATPTQADTELIGQTALSGWYEKMQHEYDFYKKNADGSLTLIKNHNRQWKGINFYKDLSSFAIAYGNVEPNTTYVFRVKTRPTNTDYNHSAYEQIEITTPAKPSEAANVVYAERFDNIIYGTDPMNFAGGFCPEIDKNKNINERNDAKVLADLDTKNGFSFSNDIGNIGAYANVGDLELPGFTTVNAVYAFLGYVRINANANPNLTTPVLSALTEASTITVSLDAACYRAWGKGNTTSKPDAAIVKVTVGDVTREIAPNEEWKTYSVTFDGVTATDAITISAVNKFYLDNIVVTK